MDNVINFLQAQKPIAYSTTTLAHKFGLKRGHVKYNLDMHEDIHCVEPAVVGSGKAHVRVYCAN